MSALATGWPTTTWNPVQGCRQVSDGCTNCWAEAAAGRYAEEGQPFHGLIRQTGTGPRWNGRQTLLRKTLAWPFTTPPQDCLVATASDLFTEHAPEDSALAVWGIMAALPQWRFYVVTKRPKAAREMLERHSRRDANNAALRMLEDHRDRGLFVRAQKMAPNHSWPPANVWLGVSIEDQATADARLPELVRAPAAVRFAVAEPLLGPVSLSRWLAPARSVPARLDAPQGVRWLVVGGETGSRARPMHPGHARALRDECRAAGTAFLFKAWGAWAPVPFETPQTLALTCEHHGRELVAPREPERSGRLLDGVLWNERP